jgi:hypothetical protein
VAAHVETTFDQYVPMSAEEAYTLLCDWDDHARWVPLTRVTTHSPEEFTAYTGLGPLALPDRMRVVRRDDASLSVTVEKIGPVLCGTAGFVVRPFDTSSCVVRWHESVRVPLVPRRLSRVLSEAARVLFRAALRRLPR